MMTHESSTRSLTLLTISIMLLHGCVAVRDDHASSISSGPRANIEDKPSVNIVLTGKRWVNETELDADSIQHGYLWGWGKQVAKVFDESGLFRQVKVSSRQMTDVRAEIKIEQRTEYNRPMRFLSAVTLWMIPVEETEILLVKGVFKDREGHVIADSEKTETMTTWRQFFLILGRAFSGRSKPIADAALEDLHRLILQEVSHPVQTMAGR